MCDSSDKLMPFASGRGGCLDDDSFWGAEVRSGNHFAQFFGDFFQLVLKFIHCTSWVVRVVFVETVVPA